MADTPDQPIQPEQHEVNLPTMQTGTVQVGTKAAFSNPAPDKLKRVLTAIRYTLTGLIVTVSGSDLFSGYQSKVISLVLGIGILVCGGVELAVGVKPLPEDK